jgi:hypothetical protein
MSTGGIHRRHSRKLAGALDNPLLQLYLRKPKVFFRPWSGM